MLAWLPGAFAQPAGSASGDSSGSSSEAAPSDAWFEVERLNPGLPAPPGALDRSTPMGAMESFLAAVRAHRFDDAAHLLDLGTMPAAQQADRGPELARRLGVILENHVWIDWDGLPDRPDALLQAAAGDDPMAGQMRRSLILDRLDIDGRFVPLRLNRVKPAGEDAAWVFSRQSVGNIDALYGIYGEGWLHEILPERWQRQSWLGLERWELVALPVLVLAAVAVFMGLRALLRTLTRTAHFARRGLQAASTPLALLGAAVPLQFATSALVTFSAPVTAILTPILVVVMVIAVAVALLRAVDALLDAVTDQVVGDTGAELAQHQRQTYTAIYAIRRIVLLLAFVAGLGFVLTQLDLFGSLGLSLLASAGVLTVILGIAAQPVLGNIVASLQIALTQPIRIGDAVEYEGNWAYVEAIFYTYVRLQSWDGRRLIVPVQYFVSKPFENWSVVDKTMTRVFLLTLDPRADVEELRQAFLEIAGADEDVMSDEMLKVLVMDQDPRGVHVCFYATARDASTAWNMHCRLREKTLAWIRDHHGDWWPRQREIQYEPAYGAEGRGRAAE